MSEENYVDVKVKLSKEERMETINQSLTEEPDLVPFEILKELIVKHKNVIAIKIAVNRYGLEYVEEIMKESSELDDFPFNLLNFQLF